MLLISGSRQIKFPLKMNEFVELVLKKARHNKWTIVCGDAEGFDTAVILEAERQLYPIHIFGSQALGYLRITTVNPNAQTTLVDTGSHKGMWLTRDKHMVEFVAAQPVRGFLGYWNGVSHGTRRTANLAKSLGIPGFLYNEMGEAERW